jgi:hypothetical protein
LRCEFGRRDIACGQLGNALFVVVVEIVANRFAFLFLYFRQWVGGNAIRGGFSKTAWNMETGG